MLALFLLGLLLAVNFSCSDLSPYSLGFVDNHFNDFVIKYKKVYANEEERLRRSQIFADNFRKVIEMNARRSQNPIYGTTPFMDLSLEEFNSGHAGLDPQFYTNDCQYLNDTDIGYVNAPESFDWRDYNCVTPVKNQYTCNSCYAFSAIANIESQIAIKYHQMVDLSEQHIVDCNKRTCGCWTGLIAPTFRFLIEFGGVLSEEIYPYYGDQDHYLQCNVKYQRTQFRVVGCFSYNLTSQEKVKQLLYQYGPIPIAIRKEKLRYIAHNGIITDEECTGPVDHGVLLVGYGVSTENGMPYWIVKNSWGPDVHDGGYFKMQRGEHADSCGMMNLAMSTAIIA